ncbi:UbiA family prenyltransferase [soil metagenome]
MALAAAAHPGPSLAVTTLAALLTVAFGGSAGLVVVVLATVLSGQLVIGWSNDLIDAERDARDARMDKPLASGAITPRSAATALGAASAVTLALSLTLGWVPGMLHLVLVVGSGVAYNLGLKATTFSFVPYALAFGALPALTWYAVQGNQSAQTLGDEAPPIWMLLVGAALGVGAHLLNALPDLAHDRAHGIHGLPHRLGAARVRLLAPALLLAGALIAVFAPPGPVTRWGWVVAAASVALSIVAASGRGKTPFRAAVGIALLAASALVVAAA